MLIKNRTLISVVVPCFNSAKTLRQCVESVISNEGDYFEVIVVDDGSIDNTREIIEDFQQKENRIFYFRKKNGGVSSARNYGISKAQGEYILFLDSDDYLPQKVMDTYKKAISENPTIDVFFGKTAHKMSSKINIREFPQTFEKGIPLIDEKYANLIGHYIKRDGIQYSSLSKLFSLKKIKENKLSFNESVFFCEDVLFNIDFFGVSNSAFVIDDVVYVVNLEENQHSLTRTYNVNQILCIEQTYDGFKLLAEKINFGSNITAFDVDKRFVDELLDVMFRIYSNKYVNLSKKSKKTEIKKILKNEYLSLIIKKYKDKKSLLNRSFPEKLFRCFSFNKAICYSVLLLYYFVRNRI